MTSKNAPGVDGASAGRRTLVHRRTVLGAAAASAAGALLAACGGGSSPTNTPAPASSTTGATGGATAISGSAVAGGATASATSATAATGPQPSKPRPDGTPAPDAEQILRMVTPSTFRMDPLTYGGDLWQLQMMVFQALTRFDEGDQLVPGVADKWESSPDGKTWTFTLNPNAKFSDGSPLTANDVKWTFDWLTNPKSKSVSADTTAGKIVGFDKMQAGTTESLEGVVVKDDHTVVFTLAAPFLAFPKLAASYNAVILKKDNVLSGGEEWWRKPVTSGFFKVTEYTPGDQATMTLERNEFWWREPAKLRQLTMKLVADPQTELVQYDNNELDGIVCQPAEFAQATKPNGPRSADLFWGLAGAVTWFFAFYEPKKPFEDVKVRQAMASALDLNALSVAALNGIYPPQKRNLPPGFTCGGDEQWQPAFNPARAKQLIAESTYGSVDKLPKMTIVISEQGGAAALGTWGKVAAAMQQQLKDNLGVNVDLVRQNFTSTAAQIDYMKNLDGSGILRLSGGASNNDPSYLGSFALSTSSGNFAQYKNPQVDDLLKQADAELDAGKRCALYSQIDQIMSQDAYFLAPFRGTSTWFFKPKVRGLFIAQQRVWNSMHKVYIAK
jgi:oligopeptide transport system substrate-binding protein